MTNNPFSDPDYLIDYNLRARDVKAGRAPKRKKGNYERKAEPVPSNGTVSSYKNLQIETLSPRDRYNKELYTFDKSLQRVKSYPGYCLLNR